MLNENIQDILDRIYQKVQDRKLADGQYARWLWQNEDGTRELGINPYGCADAANILYTLGKFPTDPTERQAWVDALQSMQDPETGLYVEKTHHTLHTTAHCSAAIELFDATPKYPMKALEQYLPEGGVEGLLDGLDWDRPWSESHQGAGIYVSVNLSGMATPEWNKRYFQWLWDNADPETGLWRAGWVNKPDAPKGIHEHMASTFHYLFNHAYAHMPLRYPEKVIDSCLYMYDETPMNPHFGKVAGFLEIDWVYCLTRASRQTPQRFWEIRDQMRDFAVKYFAWIRSADWEKNETLNDMHCLFGMICCLAELQQTLRGEIASDKPLKLVLDRRPFI